VLGGRTSEKISMTMLLATIAVVVRHAFCVHIYQPSIWSTGPYDANSLVQLLTNYCTASAVPTFFLLSGCLFFHNLDDKGLLRKWKSRVHSLLIPYLLWNALYLALFCLIVPSVPFVGRYWLHDSVAFDLRTVVQSLTISPPSSHFWFVRDLIGFVALAPLFCLIYRCRRLAGILLMGLLVYWQPVDCSLLSSEGLLFFFVGGWIGYRHLDVRRVSVEAPWIVATLCVLWLGLCVYQTLWSAESTGNEVATKTSTLIGVMVLWLSVDRICTSGVRDWLLVLAPYTFFIYASHRPMIRYIYKVLLYYVPESQYFGLCVFFATPVLTIAISVCVAKCLHRYAGGVYALMTGGRLPPHDRKHECATRAVTQPI